MSFTRDDLTTYEAKPQVNDPSHDPFNPASPAAKEPEAPPQAKEEAEVDAAIAASVAEPSDTGTDNDGSTTETQAEPVAADDVTPEDEKDSDLEDITDGKPRSRAQARIEELVAERNALRRYGEYLLQQVEASRKAPTQDTRASQPSATETIEQEQAPTLEDADFDPVKLSKMHSEWIDKQVDKRVNAAVQQIKSQQSEQAIRSAFEARAAEFSKTAQDFNVVIANPALPPLANVASREVIKSEIGPAIVYHLAKNPDLAARIARLEPSSQLTAIGRLEEQLMRSKTEEVNTTKEPSKKPEPAKKPVSVTKAPPPPKPIQASAPPSKDENIMGMEEWVAQDRAKKLKLKQDRLALRKALR